MIRLITHIRLLLLIAVAGLVFISCDKQLEREICDYKLLLRYDYNEENTSQGVNMIEYYIHTIDEYVFDEDGLLYAHKRTTPDRCREMLNSEWDLEPGRYSVIAIGNMDGRSTPRDAQHGDAAPEIGVTHRDYMRLTLDNCGQHEALGGLHGPSERLYYGYKTFTVKREGISRVRVDMVNSHLQLRLRVTWKNNATPPSGNDYYVVLDNVPSPYALMPEFIYPSADWTCKTHDPDTDDLYPTNCNAVIHHIPATCFGMNNPLLHRNDTKVTVDKEMRTEFVTYRIRNEQTKPLLHIYKRDGTPVRENIKLYRYFEHYEIDLDHTLKQDYAIDIVIDGGQVVMLSLDVADYEEGGQLGN